MGEVVRDKIDNKVKEGWVLSLFEKTHPMVHLRVFPAEVMPKKNEGEYRFIYHLSYPEGD